jgi:hypothetical protein
VSAVSLVLESSNRPTEPLPTFSSTRRSRCAHRMGSRLFDSLFMLATLTYTARIDFDPTSPQPSFLWQEVKDLR